ncbi:MAG: polysulfide reductase, partial [Eggerthellaceae bacterium]|nr:polysulfide reductase [Eggerthellaceae bacterium]
VAAAVVCFVPSLRTSPLLALAGVAAILAILCKRVQLLVGGFQIPNIEWPAVMTPSTVTNWQGNLEQAYAGMVYWPAPIEWGVALGVVALAVLIFLLGLKFLPLKPADGE